VNIDDIKPVLPHDTVFLPTDTGMYIRRNERVMTLKGKSIHGAFLRLAPLLDGHQTLASLCAGLPDGNAAALRQLLTTLIDKKVLIARSDDDQALLTSHERACYASQLAFLEHLVDRPGAALLRLRTARVYLDGAGIACQAAGKTLLRNGVGQLYLAAGIDDDLAAVLEQTAAGLREQGVNAAVLRLAGDFGEEYARHAFDFAAYVSDRPAFDTLAGLTRQCAAERVALFPAVLIDGAARIGPLPAAHGPGCWNCAFLRLLDQVPAPLAAQLWRHRALGLPYVAEAQYSGAPLLQVMGNGLAFRLFQHACGIADDADAHGHAVESISGMTLEARAGTVLAHPDCTLAHRAAPVDAGIDALAAERMLVAADFGLFAAFDDDTLKQVPVFQSRLRRSGAAHDSYPGNSMASNAQARRQALLAGALGYALGRAPGPGVLLSSAQAARSAAAVIDTDAVTGRAGLADPARHVSSWLWAVDAADGRPYLLAGTDVFGAGVPGEPALQLPGSGAGAGFGVLEARRAAVLALVTRQGLQAVADGDVVPAPSDPAGWAPELAAYFELLRQTAPAAAAWTFTVDETAVVLVALDAAGADGRQVLVGAGAHLDDAARQALTEALAVSAGGASASTWNDFLPPQLGYGPFGAAPAPASGRAHGTLSALAGGGDAQAVRVVYCDVTPADLAQAGIVVVKAALVRHAGATAAVDSEAACAA
jgi:hypothetical protein